MLITFRGRGWLIGVVLAGSLLLSDFLTGAYFHDARYYDQHGWPKLTACWVTAVIVLWMLPRSKDEVLGVLQADPEQKSILTDHDTLFSVPAKYWPIVLFALGVFFYFI